MIMISDSAFINRLGLAIVPYVTFNLWRTCLLPPSGLGGSCPPLPPRGDANIYRGQAGRQSDVAEVLTINKYIKLI